jgi:KaiC/GvpD/RAD55 family RecA-like ATPase
MDEKLERIMKEVEAAGLQEGENVLLISKPGEEKFIFGIKYLDKELSINRKGIYITTDALPSEIERKSEKYSVDLKRYTGSSLFFIDSYSWTLGENKEKIVGRKDIIVPGPSALNDLSIGLSQALKACSERPVLIFHSLSTLFLYNEPEVTFRFLQIIGARLKANDATSIFFCEENMHDERVMTTLKHLMDRYIEL